jgi:hypothetical protein
VRRVTNRVEGAQEMRAGQPGGPRQPGVPAVASTFRGAELGVHVVPVFEESEIESFIVQGCSMSAAGLWFWVKLIFATT